MSQTRRQLLSAIAMGTVAGCGSVLSGFSDREVTLCGLNLINATGRETTITGIVEANGEVVFEDSVSLQKGQFTDFDGTPLARGSELKVRVRAAGMEGSTTFDPESLGKDDNFGESIISVGIVEPDQIGFQIGNARCAAETTEPDRG